MSNFYEALGYFTHTYANVEATLKIYVTELVGLSRREGMALFGGMRVKGLQDTIKHIHEARATAPEPGPHRALVQLRHIHFMRDMLLHNGFMRGASGGQLITTNYISARSAESAKTYPISIDDLESMIVDLETIDILLMLSFKDPPTLQTPGLLALSQRPWLYTHSQPIRPTSSTPGTPQEQTRPPPSSDP